MQAPPIALRSVLEGEIRGFAAHQGVDGHRQCMRKFLELLLARGEALHISEVQCRAYAAGYAVRFGRLCTCSAESHAKVRAVKTICLLHNEGEPGAGVLSQSQVLLAFGVVAELFNGVRDAEPLDGKHQ